MKILIALFLSSSSVTFAQDNIGLRNIKAGITSSADAINLEGQSGPTTNYFTSPSSGLSLGLTIGPAVLMIDGSQVSDKDKTMYGETKTSRVNFLYHGLNHSFDVKSESFQSVYINNSKEIDATWSGENRIQRPDIKQNNLRFDYLYTFSPEEFHLAILDQSLVPAKSGGSLILNANATQYSLTGEPIIAPTQVAGVYGDVGTTKRMNLTSARAGIGGGYVFEYSGFYIGGMGLIAVGPQMQQFEDTVSANDETRTVVSTDVQGKVSIGYNAESFFTALNIEAIGTGQKIRTGNLITVQSQTGLWIGWRFN